VNLQREKPCAGGPSTEGIPFLKKTMRYDRKAQLPAAASDKTTLLRRKSTIILIRKLSPAGLFDHRGIFLWSLCAVGPFRATVNGERAEQHSQAETELLNILSHELKTPLTVIASYSQALKSSALGEINRDQERAVIKILQQTEHLENIVNVILESASVETGAVAAGVVGISP